jgi:hypothetical protein
MSRRQTLAVALIGLAANWVGAGTPARSAAEPRVEGPFTHRNLSIYVVSGAKAPDARRFLTLDEGLRSGRVAVREQGARGGVDRAQVNELEVENASDQWLYLQAGDVVAGGKQDRTIATDVAIPPHSGPRPIAAFCVEHGRWTPKSASGMAFAGSPAIVGSNELKRSIQEDRNQQKVWAEVARQESRAAAKVAVAGEAPATALSSTGTYRAIVENARIGATREEYVQALLPRIEKTADAVGIVVAIDGRISAADVYGSPELFHKLARKILASYAQEASLAGESSAAAPTLAAARAFLRDLPASRSDEKVADSVYRTTRKSGDSVVFEYGEQRGESSSRTLLHRNYVRN